MAQNENRPVADSGIAPVPREAPYRAGGKQQDDLSTRKEDLLHTQGVGHVPGRADSPRLADQYVMDHQPYKRPGREMRGVAQAGPRPLPREVPVYSIPAPGGTGRFTRYADGHTEHHRERPGMIEYLRSLNPDDPDEADEHADVLGQVQAADEPWGHEFW